MKFQATLLIAAMLAQPAFADAVTDALAAADQAYAAGDLAATAKALTAATNDVAKQRSAVFAALLPAAPDGYTRTDSEDFAAGMAMFGGGAGAEARYASGDTSFTISIMADNDMVNGMMGMFSSPEMLAMMGEVEQIGDASVVTAEDGSIMSIIGGRFMLSANGATAEVMMPVVKAIDFAKLSEMAKQ